MSLMEICVKYKGFVRMSDASGLYVSWCPMLDVVSQGRTQAEAQACLDDAVRLFVVHSFKRGILERVLAERGLVPVDEPSDVAIQDPDDSGEGISVRPASAPLHAWDGSVPLHLMGSAGAAWPP